MISIYFGVLDVELGTRLSVLTAPRNTQKTESGKGSLLFKHKFKKRRTALNVMLHFSHSGVKYQSVQHWDTVAIDNIPLTDFFPLYPLHFLLYLTHMPIYQIYRHGVAYLMMVDSFRNPEKGGKIKSELDVEPILRNQHTNMSESN